MRLILWILGFIIAVSVTAFAVFNRHAIDAFWSPFHPPLQIPLYAVGIGFMAYGFIAGAVIVWFSGGSVRKSRRQQLRKIRELQKDLEEADDKYKQAVPPADFFPALPAARKGSK